MIENDNIAHLKEFASYSFDIAMMFVGVGEIRLALRMYKQGRNIRNGIKLILGIADLASSGMDFYCNNQKCPDSDCQEICQEWKEVSVYVQLGLLSTKALENLLSSSRVRNWISGRKLADAGSDLSGYVNSLINKNIRNAILDIAESRIVAQKYFNRIKQNPSNYLIDYTLHLDDFDNWYNNIFKSNLFEAHHVIPKNVLRDNPNLQSILDWARNNNKTWDFGDIDNGIMLQKRRKNSLGEVVGDHANHPSYDTDVSDKIDDIFNESNGNMSDAYDDFVDFVNDLKTELYSQVVEGDRIVNNLIVP